MRGDHVDQVCIMVQRRKRAACSCLYLHTRTWPGTERERSFGPMSKWTNGQWMNYVLLKHPLNQSNQNRARVHPFFIRSKSMLWVVTSDHPGTFSDPCFFYFLSCSLILSLSISILSRLDLGLSNPFISLLSLALTLSLSLSDRPFILL